MSCAAEKLFLQCLYVVAQILAIVSKPTNLNILARILMTLVLHHINDYNFICCLCYIKYGLQVRITHPQIKRHNKTMQNKML